MKRRIILMLLAVFCCQGCGDTRQPLTVTREAYEKKTYETAEVQCGDISPQLVLTLTAEDYKKISYDAVSPQLTLDTVYVSVGDHVEKGDLLVSFRCDSLQETIDSYTEQYEENRLLLEHYTKLMQLDKNADYSGDIRTLKEDMQVEQLYIEEATEKLSDYQIVAKKSGMIVGMRETLKFGIYEPGKDQIVEACASRYTAERPDDYTFRKGEVYTAKAGTAEYKVKVTSVTEDQVFFTPVSGAAQTQELTLTVTQKALSNVVYVTAEAVHHVGGKYFVYVLDEDGFCDAAEIVTGDRVGEYYIVEEGLFGGEKVTVE